MLRVMISQEWAAAEAELFHPSSLIIKISYQKNPKPNSAPKHQTSQDIRKPKINNNKKINIFQLWNIAS